MNEQPGYKELERHINEFLKYDESLVSQLISCSFDMIVLLNPKGTQYYVSESCERILGYEPEELMDISVIEEMIHPEDQAKVLEGLKGILEHTNNGGTQYRHRHKNGSWVYLETFGTNQIDNPKINSVVLNIRDITERKKTEQELIESRARLSEAIATKDRFYSIIGHDLKSPFNSIIGFSEMLLEQVQAQDYNCLEDYAKIIYDSSQRAMDLLSNLLDWSRSQTGKIEFNPESFELVPLINDVVDLYNTAAKQKSILILKKLPHAMVVIADKAMVNTILRNLISNAIKFTNPGGEITIRVQQKAEELVVSIADNGIGIKKENINKLFRLECGFSTPGTNNEKGTGLGLLLCKEFVEMHGGKIWANPKETEGIIFNFSIPLIRKKFTHLNYHP